MSITWPCMHYSLDGCNYWPLDGDVDLHFQSAELFPTLPEEHSPRSLSSPGSEHQKAAQREGKCILHQMTHGKISQWQFPFHVPFHSSAHTHTHNVLNFHHPVRLLRKWMKTHTCKITTNLSIWCVNISLIPSLQNVRIIEARATNDTNLNPQKKVKCNNSLMNLISNKNHSMLRVYLPH